MDVPYSGWREVPGVPFLSIFQSIGQPPTAPATQLPSPFGLCSVIFFFEMGS